MSRSAGLERRVAAAAGEVLARQQAVTPVDVCVRHQDTDYDDLLMSGVPRDEARDRIRPAIDCLLAAWSLSRAPSHSGVSHPSSR